MLDLRAGFIGSVAVLVLGGAAAAAWLAGREPPSGAAQGARLEALFNRCVEQMLRQTCRAMTGPAAEAAPAGSVIFVAGVGPVDARSYAELRGAGEGMCALVRERCRESWDGAACTGARAIVGG